MAEERDIIVFVDEDNNEIEMEVFNYFYYNGKEYAVMAEPTECNCPSPEECTCEPVEIMFAEVVPVEGSEEDVEFIPVEDEDLADKLFEIISTDAADDIDD